MIVASIAAVAENGAIGKENDLIWDLPIDMKFFMDTTRGHHVITGRKNYESIPHKFRPLKNRVNIVVTRDEAYEAPGAVVLTSIREAIELARAAGEEECFVIGGGEIYALALREGLLDRMYITHVDAEFDADTFYPEFNRNDWVATVLAEHQPDERHAYAFKIVRYDRKAT
jgi:dihydrofolate reductase